MEDKKLTYWQFLTTNNYQLILLFLIAMLVIGIVCGGGVIWISIFSTAIIAIIIGGFWLHWKEYNSKK